MAKRLAICIPAHNAASHLPRLFESIKHQTRPFDEVLVYDDASTDNTGEVARLLGADVHCTSINTGCSIGKNRLASITTCEWVHFHDADDALHPEFVERAHDALMDDVDVVLMGTEDRDDRTGESLAVHTWDNDALIADAVRYCIVHNVTNCGVYRRSRFVDVGGFDSKEQTTFNEDQAMHLRLALAGLRFRALEYVGTIIYRRQNSMSSGNQIACARAQYHVMESVAEATGRTYALELGNRLWRLAGVCGAHDDWAYVERCLTLADNLGQPHPTDAHLFFQLLARMHPMSAIKVREHAVRWLKPRLRSGTPVVSHQ